MKLVCGDCDEPMEAVSADAEGRLMRRNSRGEELGRDRAPADGRYRLALVMRLSNPHAAPWSMEHAFSTIAIPPPLLEMVSTQLSP